MENSHTVGEHGAEGVEIRQMLDKVVSDLTMVSRQDGWMDGKKDQMKDEEE